MIIVLARVGNGYCGCENEDAFFYEEEISEREIEADVYNFAIENAETYSYVHFGWDEEYTEEEYDDYMENYVTYDWDVVTYEEYLEWCDDQGVEPVV